MEEELTDILVEDLLKEKGNDMSTKSDRNLPLNKTENTFGDILQMLKNGYKATCDELDGVIFIVPGSNFKVNRPPLLGLFEEGTSVTYQEHIDIIYEDGTIGVWSVSQQCIFSNSWRVV